MEKNREELKRSRVNSSQGAHSAGTYPGSYNMKRLGVVLIPLAFHQAFLTIRRYPFMLLGKERRCESKKYSSQEYRTMTQPGFESGSQCSDHKATALPLSSYPMLLERATTSRYQDKSLGHRLLRLPTGSQRQSIEELRLSADED